MAQYIVRKVTEYRGMPVLITQCGNLFIYTICIGKDFYSATIESVPPFYRKHTDLEALEATNLALMAARTTVDAHIDKKK